MINYVERKEMQQTMKMTLKAVRVNAGLTQKEAAEHVGVSETTWANYERAKTFPDIEKLKTIEKTFNVTYDDIIFLPQTTV